MKYKGTLYHHISSTNRKFYSSKKKKSYRLETVKKKTVSYDSRMIIYKTENIFFIIFDLLEEMIIYHKEWIIFDIVEIGRYNMIFRML